MKRFYCNECKKIKRVRRLPDDIETPFADNPEDRIGKCSHHNTPKGFSRIPLSTLIDNFKAGKILMRVDLALLGIACLQKAIQEPNEKTSQLYLEFAIRDFKTAIQQARRLGKINNDK